MAGRAGRDAVGAHGCELFGTGEVGFASIVGAGHGVCFANHSTTRDVGFSTLRSRSAASVRHRSCGDLAKVAKLLGQILPDSVPQAAET